MLIKESTLRRIIREEARRSLLHEASGSGSFAPVNSVKKKGKGGYEYELFSNGKVQIVSKDGKPYATPKVLNQAMAVAVAKEQIEYYGNKGTLVRDIAAGTLVFGGDGAPAASPAAPVIAAGAAPQKGIALIARQDYAALKPVSAAASDIADSLFGQGHGFCVVVDPVSRLGHRFDFGRYPEAEKCPDDRWLTKAGIALAAKFGMGANSDPAKSKTPAQWFNSLGISTMGVLHHSVGRVAAVVGPDGKIANMKEFCAGLKKGTDVAGTTQLVAVPVNNVSGAMGFANARIMKCLPYALPGAQLLTYKDTENCGTMAQKILMAGAPDGLMSIEAQTLVDTPDALYNTLVRNKTLQTGAF